ncbi:MAG: prenyltransferase/squalene oxidase repeat-containing protein [Candidatus Helarchaeota archaeon]
MSKKEILDEIQGNISVLENHFQQKIDQLVASAEYNLNPAIKLGINWLLRTQNEDGGFGIHEGKPSLIHLTAFALLALAKAGKTQDDPNISKALEYLRLNQTNKGGWPYKKGNLTESVGVTGMIFQALDLLNFSRSDELFKIALDFLKAQFSEKEVCWQDNQYSDFWEISVNESALSAVVKYMTHKKEQEQLNRFKEKFLEFDSDEGYGWKLDKNIVGDIENTAIALKLLANLGVTKLNDTKLKTVEKAVNYILSARIKGGFPPKRQLRKKFDEVENDATSLVLSGLIASEFAPYDDIIHEAAKFLSESQNPDGGWGDAPMVESDTDSTALAIIALVDAARGGVPLAKAEEYLLNTQEFINQFIERYVGKLDEDLRAAQRLNRLLELNITFLAILIPIIISLII